MSGSELSPLRLSTITGMRSGCFARIEDALALRVSRSCLLSFAMLAAEGVKEKLEAVASKSGADWDTGGICSSSAETPGRAGTLAARWMNTS